MKQLSLSAVLGISLFLTACSSKIKEVSNQSTPQELIEKLYSSFQDENGLKDFSDCYWETDDDAFKVFHRYEYVSREFLRVLTQKFGTDGINEFNKISIIGSPYFPNSGHEEMIKFEDAYYELINEKFCRFKHPAKGNQFELKQKSGYWFIKNGPHSPKRLGRSLSGILEFLSEDAEGFDIGLSLLKKDAITLKDIQSIKEKNVLPSS